jgi:hypothetical protein
MLGFKPWNYIFIGHAELKFGNGFDRSFSIQRKVFHRKVSESWGVHSFDSRAFHQRPVFRNTAVVQEVGTVNRRPHPR